MSASDTHYTTWIMFSPDKKDADADLELRVGQVQVFDYAGDSGSRNGIPDKRQWVHT